MGIALQPLFWGFEFVRSIEAIQDAPSFQEHSLDAEQIFLVPAQPIQFFKFLKYLLNSRVKLHEEYVLSWKADE